MLVVRVEEERAARAAQGVGLVPQEGVVSGVGGGGLLLLLEGCGKSIGEWVDLWVDSVYSATRHDTRARLGTYPGRPRRCPAG